MDDIELQRQRANALEFYSALPEPRPIWAHDWEPEDGLGSAEFSEWEFMASVQLQACELMEHWAALPVPLPKLCEQWSPEIEALSPWTLAQRIATVKHLRGN